LSNPRRTYTSAAHSDRSFPTSTASQIGRFFVGQLYRRARWMVIFFGVGLASIGMLGA